MSHVLSWVVHLACLQVLHGLGSVQAALRQMSQARHVGKVVVRSPALGPQQAQRQGAGGTGEAGSLVPKPCKPCLTKGKNV